MKNKIAIGLDSIELERLAQFASINNASLEDAAQMLITQNLQEIADKSIELQEPTVN